VAFLDEKLNSLWAKLPLIRKLMLTHPEVEWIFWVDADAMITDMVFEMPLEEYDQYNIIMWGFDQMVFEDKNWVGMNTGVFFIRNCQWSMDLFDMWVPMGPEGKVRTEVGKFFTDNLTQGKGKKRPVMPADDQSALVYLMLTKEEVLRPKVFLEGKRYVLSGYFNIIVDHFEEYMAKHHPGLGDDRWPFTTHFTGCQPCTGKGNPNYGKDRCQTQFERAFNFADNQVMSLMGFHHKCLECVELKRIAEETDRPLDALNGENTWLPSAAPMKQL
jgi:xyloglucan 6-xylosyltransferase